VAFYLVTASTFARNHSRRRRHQYAIAKVKIRVSQAAGVRKTAAMGAQTVLRARAVSNLKVSYLIISDLCFQTAS
jgi:hypothetical protein